MPVHHPEMPSTPLLIIALDAGDPDFILKTTNEGLLPCISSILRAGSHGRLAGTEMVSLHGIWTAFFTGARLIEHGYYMHYPLEPGTYQLKHRPPAAQPFWSEFRDGSHNVLIVDAPDVEPVPGIAGHQISEWGTHPTPVRVLSSPPDFRKTVLDIAGARVKTDEKKGNARGDARTLKQILQRVRKKGKLGRHMIQQHRPALSVIGFGDLHAAAHRFRKYGQDANSKLKSALADVYQAVDQEIGSLKAACNSEPNICIAADSGILDGYPIRGLVHEFCSRLGYTVHNKTRFGGMINSFNTLLHRKRLTAGIHWQRTSAFAIPGQYTGYIRVNLRGREPAGIVNEGPEYESLLDRIESDLMQLTDGDTGKRLVRKIFRTTRACASAAPPRTLPDLIIDWIPSPKPLRCILHPAASFLSKSKGRANCHSDTGLILAAGPSIETRGFSGDFSPAEFAALFRALLGLSSTENSATKSFLRRA
jgi:predicted AlkP superfamily phosphohydrolase/phosphomutase